MSIHETQPSELAALAGVPFTKGHGTRNDFVVLPDPDGALPLTPELVGAVCDRRAGVGADGLLRVVRAAKHPEAADQADAAEWFMDYWNADGSLAEMCGNGARVYARYLADTGLAAGPVIPIATRSGVRIATITPDAVSVDMTRPRRTGASTAETTEGRHAGTVVDAGNPHLVCSVADPATLTALDLTQPPRLDPAAFPSGANVEFVGPVDGPLHVRMRVHERGAGETASCGTGACAAAAVTLAATGTETGTVTVDVPGGRLTITLTEDTCHLAGPAVLVASGTLGPPR